MLTVMKKVMVCGVAILLLTGCNSSGSSKEQVAGAESEKTSPPTNVQKGKEIETANQQTLSPEEVINETEKQLETSVPIKLPKTVNVSSAKHLTAKTNSTNDQYTVKFLETNEPIPINNEELENKEVNIAILKATRYESAEQAAQQINYEDHSSIGGHEVDLGFGIKGYSEGAAGSQYIGWNEGRWSFEMRGLTEQGEEVSKEAKNLVAFLEKHTLPVPHDLATAKLDVTNNHNDQKQSISWQEDKVVYEVEMNKDAQDLLELTTSIQENK